MIPPNVRCVERLVAAQREARGRGGALGGLGEPAVVRERPMRPELPGCVHPAPSAGPGLPGHPAGQRRHGDWIRRAVGVALRGWEEQIKRIWMWES